MSELGEQEENLPAQFQENKPSENPAAEHQSLKISQYQALYSGPIPPAEILAKYNSAFLGGAQAVFDMADKEQAHRHKMEEQSMLIAAKLEEMQMNSIGCFSWLVYSRVTKPTKAN